MPNGEPCLVCGKAYHASPLTSWCAPCAEHARGVVRATGRSFYDVLRDMRDGVLALEPPAPEPPAPEPTPALTLDDFTFHVTEVARGINPATGVVVDHMNGSSCGKGCSSPVFLAWLTLGSSRVEMVHRSCRCVVRDNDVQAVRDRTRNVVDRLCREVGRAWRPEGWRTP